MDSNDKPIIDLMSPRIESLIHDGVGYSCVTAEDLRAAKVPEAVINAAFLDQRRTAVASECRRRIYAVASPEAQRNMAVAAAAIAAKPAASRTEIEKAMLTSITASLDWVQAMRLAVATISADAALDPATDANWPACPSEVVAMAQQF